MKYALLAILLSAVYAAAQVSYPVGTVIEVTDDGVTVTAPDDAAEDEADEVADGPATPVVYVDESEYCYGADYAVVDCDASRNYDPWVASTGERAYWIRNQLTISIPFTLPSRDDADDVRYGYFQMTSPQSRRDPATDDVFRVWFSSEPNGEPLGGRGSKCEKWLVQARGNFHWTQDQSLSGQLCFLGETAKVLYANFETACYAPRYEGSCSDTNKQKSASSYQFDVARLVKGY
jgi:hypothetical protein